MKDPVPPTHASSSLTLAELAPLLDEAAALGVEQFAFTGGEPLILRDIHAILLHALQLRPVLVLTNGTAPFIRRAHHLASLRAAPHALRFRVSIDYADEARHDAGRGLKNFRKAIDGLRLLHDAGFDCGITRQQEPGEDSSRGAITAFAICCAGIACRRTCQSWRCPNWGRCKAAYFPCLP